MLNDLDAFIKNKLIFTRDLFTPLKMLDALDALIIGLF